MSEELAAALERAVRAEQRAAELEARAKDAEESLTESYRDHAKLESQMKKHKLSPEARDAALLDYAKRAGDAAEESADESTEIRSRVSRVEGLLREIADGVKPRGPKPSARQQMSEGIEAALRPHFEKCGISFDKKGR